MESGFLVIDKPSGQTSRQVVDQVVRLLGTRRVGHAGTLDPLASGVLVVAIEKATRLIEYVQAMPKTYTSTFLMGVDSDTDDADGAVTQRLDSLAPGENAVREALSGFVGWQEQQPPAYSALKVGGKRAYAAARAGMPLELAPRKVRVDAIELLDYAYPRVRVRVACGGGTYIRSLARDVGQKLGVGGIVETLRRTAIGQFREANAVPLDSLTHDNCQQWLRPIGEAVRDLPAVRLNEQQHWRFETGQLFSCQVDGLTIANEVDRPLSAARVWIAVFTPGDEFAGVAAYDPTRQLAKAEKAGFAPSPSRPPCGMNES